MYPRVKWVGEGVHTEIAFRVSEGYQANLAAAILIEI